MSHLVGNVDNGRGLHEWGHGVCRNLWTFLSVVLYAKIKVNTPSCGDKKENAIYSAWGRGRRESTEKVTSELGLEGC